MYDVLKEDTKMRKEDRILGLTVIDGKKPISAQGLIDSRLFKGGNKLHAIKDSATQLWYLKYEDGNIPPGLRQRFTKYDYLLDHVRNYFKNRNLSVTEILD